VRLETIVKKLTEVLRKYPKNETLMKRTLQLLTLSALFLLFALPPMQAQVQAIPQVANSQEFIPYIQEEDLGNGLVKLKIGTEQGKFEWSTGEKTPSIVVDGKRGGEYGLTYVTPQGHLWKSNLRLASSNNNLRSGFTECAGSGASYPGQVCAGQQVKLNATASFSGAQYSWSTGESTSEIWVTPTNNATYSVTITGSNPTCTSVHTLGPIQVLSSSNISITNIAAVSNHWDCTPGNMNVEVYISNYNLQSNHEYSLNGGPWSNSLTFGPLGRGDMTARARLKNNSTCPPVELIKYVDEFQGFEGGTFIYENLGDCQLNNVSVSYGKESGFGGGGMEFRIDNRPWQILSTFTGLGSGTYTYYARQSGGGCAFSTTFTVTETQGPALSGASVENQQDCITGNAQITAQINNVGSNQLEYQLNGGAWQSSPVFSNLSSGTYTLAIRSTGGSCAASSNTFTQTINEVYVPVINQIAVLNDNDCTTGNIQLTATLANPVAGIQYRRNGGAWQSSPTFSGLSSGNHTIEATLPGASGGCIASLSRNVMEFQTVSLTALTKLNDLDCTTGNAIIEAVHNGGTLGGIEFRLNSGPWQSSNRFTGLSNGTYTVATRISGAGGCTLAGNSLQTTITERSGNVVISSVTKPGETDCFVGNSRVAVFLATPVPGVYYRLKVPNKLWQTSNDVSVGGSGTYVIQASTINTPGSCIAEITVEVNEVAGAVTALNLTGHTDCQMNNVTITAVHTDTPNSGIQFRLKKNNDAFGPWQNSPEFRNQGNGTYVVESKTSNNCTGSRTITVDEGPAVVPQITGLAMIGDDTDCVNGNADFRLITNESNFYHEYRVNGGTWRNPISNPFNAPYYYNFSRDSITAELRYQYGDSNTSWTCIVRTRLLVNEHVPLEITSVSTALVDDCLRNNAQATVNVKNSFGTVRYNRNGGTFRIGNPIFTNLSSGEHTFIALDDRLCRDTMVVNFTEPALLKITTTTKANETDCIPNNATITVSTSGARGGLSYRAGTGPWFGSNPISGLGTGTYKVMAQDATGCKDSVNVSISEKAMPAVTKVQDSVEICAGASTSLSIDGGGTYNWSNSLGSTATVSVSPSATITYTVTVTHASSGCTVLATRKVIVRSLPVFNVNTPSACANQIGFLNVGTSESLTYSWGGTAFTTNGSIYLIAGASTTLVAKNQWGCTSPALTVGVGIIPTGGQILGPDEVCPGVPFTLTLRPSGGPDFSQTYTITAPQVIPLAGFSNGCPFNASKVIGIKPLPTLQIQAPDSLCTGTSTIATASTSLGVSYLWSTGSTSPTLPIYAGETMSLTVTAPNGCTATDSHTIHSLPIPAPAISASGPLNCAGDSVTLSASGLLPGTSYQWSNGASTASIRVAPEVPTAYILSATRSGCVGISNVLTLTPPTALSISDTLVQPTCYGTATGRIGISVAGGTLPYVYVWSNGASTASINSLRAGTYSVTVTDGKGCSLVESFLLGEPAKMQVLLSKAGDEDCQAGNVQLKARSQHARGPIQLSLNNAAFDTISNWTVGNGFYRVQARDSLGCVAWDSIDIREQPVSIQSITLLNANDCTLGNLAIKILASGDFQPFNYAVNEDSFGTSNVLTLPKNQEIVKVKVRDNKTCEAVQDFLVPGIDSVIIESKDISDCSQADGTIQISFPVGSQDSLAFSIDGGLNWQNGTGLFLGLTPGLYRPAVKILSRNCVLFADTVRISAPGCLPLAGFTKDKIIITQADQRIILPWRVFTTAWGQVDTAFSLMVTRIGDGVPHFVAPRSDVSPAGELRSTTLGVPKWYARTFAGGDSLELFLQESAEEFLEPGEYVFQLSGNKVKIAPGKGRLTVYVDFDNRVLETPISTCLTKEITLTAQDGECWYWEGITPGNTKTVVIKNHVPGTIYKVYYLKGLKQYIQIFNIDDKTQIPVSILGPTELCPSEITKLSAKVQPSAAGDWTFKWQDGSTTADFTISPTQTTTYTLTVKQLSTGCEYQVTHTVNLKPQKTEYSLLSNGGNSICPGKSVRLFLGPVWPNGTTFKWSTPGSGTIQTEPVITADKVGTYRVTVTFASTGCSRVYSLDILDGSSPCEIKKYFQNNGFLAIPIKIIKPVVQSPELRGGACPANSCSNSSTGICVSDLAKYQIELKGRVIGNLEQLQNTLLNGFRDKWGYDNAKSQITKNELFCCENFIPIHESSLANSKLGYWIHLWENSNCETGGDVLFIKAKTPNGSYSSADLAFLQESLKYFDKRQDSQGENYLAWVQDLMLDNHSEPKQIKVFTDKYEPKREVPLQLICNDGFKQLETPVISASGQLLMLPARSIWRFDRNPEVAKIAMNGILTGFTTFASNSLEILGIYHGRYHTKTLDHLGYFDQGVDVRKTFLQTAVEFNTPVLESDGQIGVYHGSHLDLSKGRECNESFIIFETRLRPKGALYGGTYSSGVKIRPTGAFVKSLVDVAENQSFERKQQHAYSICPESIGSAANKVAQLGPNAAYDQLQQLPALIHPDGLRIMLKVQIPLGGTEWFLIEVAERGKADFCEGAYRIYRWYCQIAAWREVKSDDLRAFQIDCYTIKALFDFSQAARRLHEGLQITSFIPVVGDIASLINGMIYLAEGDLGRGTEELFFGIIGLGGELGALAGIGPLRFADEAADGAATIRGFARSTPCKDIPGFNSSTPESGPCLKVDEILGQKRTKELIDALKRDGYDFDGAPLDLAKFIHGTRLGDEFYDWLKTANLSDFAKLWKKASVELRFDQRLMDDLLEDIIKNPGLMGLFTSGAKSERMLQAWKYFKLGGNRVERLELDQLTRLADDLDHPKWGKEIRDWLEADPSEISIWIEVRKDPHYHWDLVKENPSAAWLKWSQGIFFKEVTALGRKFEGVAETAMRARSANPHYLQIQQELGKNLDEYDLYTQVQLTVSGDDYLVADQIFIKWRKEVKTVNGVEVEVEVVDDVIVLEVKLKSGTDLTTNQKAGLNSTTQLTVRSVRRDPISPRLVGGPGIPLVKNTELSVNPTFYKVYDGDNGDVIVGVQKLK
jgi:SprB repeat